MAVSRRVQEFMSAASWIRRMFEQGAELKRKYGSEAVFDFSLGNPDLEPPEAFFRALEALVVERPAGAHRYMQNAGYPETRARIAAKVLAEHGVDPGASGVVMTVGAAGALNVCFKALLDPGSEVIVLDPYFPEYRFYVDNHGGALVQVPTGEDFDLDLDAVERALTPRTRAIVVNSPNNPTGRVYSQDRLDALGALVDAKAPEATIITDEPYRRIVYDGVVPGSVLRGTARSAVATSFSKDLGLAGERIGFLAVHPEHPDREAFLGAAVFANRTLGFVNAPALMQRVVARMEDVTVDLERYARRRSLFLEGLRAAGYECVTPEGAFYLFPRSPIPDDVAFVQELLNERILAVPGSGFARPGFFRLSYAVPGETIERALPGFARARERLLA
ncbi:MAG: pyridoxal phosphate-dependent aminotransferase [Planctomycetota bacterium]|nr:MAG: pyridoxal phosphate-dependent aminotransferase [Planctomycetota bacterium]